MRLAGAHEVRDLLGVSRQRVYQLAARPDFPKPVAVLAQGKIWLIGDIEEWIAKYRLRVGYRPRGGRPSSKPIEEQVRDLGADLVGVGT